MRIASAVLAATGLLHVSQEVGTCLAAGISTQFQISGPKPPSSWKIPFWGSFRNGALNFWLRKHQADKIPNEKSLLNELKLRYAHEIVVRFNVTTSDQSAALAAAATGLLLDVWTIANDFVDIRLRRENFQTLLQSLPASLQTAHSVLVPDVAITVYNSLPNRIQTPPFAGGSLLGSADETIFFQDYQPLTVVVRWLQLLDAMFPSFVEYFSIGASFEGRDIPALRLRVRPLTDYDPPRKTVIVIGGLHAREWISTSTVNYLAWSFITTFGKERMITKLLTDFDFIFIPIINPDGMEYSWHEDRLWRKSRQETSIRHCQGLDLDHTFGYGWYNSQAQSPCSESYGGEEPFQAVETAQLAAWTRNETQNNVKFVGLLDLHSYSQQILFPFAFSCQSVPPNLENLEELAAGIAKAIRIANGESYSVTSACRGVAAKARDFRRKVSLSGTESGGGSAVDWFYHEMGAHFSYQIKLRDTGSYGFLLPKDQIVPTGEEMFSAMKYFGDYLLGNNGIERLFDQDGYDADANLLSL
ncbi:zinc carboxypeptidase [Moelleriella libera RCEF 2490]|uniref:Inactive metallocarboxypeptidase ECM14 n=1 Tax=Moelleriella libera RCEF 2490 TaxID=1081109 RepID=A0A162IWE5_9HYPO|nr:zinc carboxypeptidase [Moelleriella libera RCEF 2490]